jgi:hypothetical protein
MGSSSRRRQLLLRTDASSRLRLCKRSTVGLLPLAHTVALQPLVLLAVTVPRHTAVRRAHMHRQVTRVQGMPVLVLLAQVLQEAMVALLPQEGMVRRLLLLGVRLPVHMVVQLGSTVVQQARGVGMVAHLRLLLEAPGVRVGMLGRMGAGLLLLVVLLLELELVVLLLGDLRILQRVSMALCPLPVLLEHKRGLVSG